jgi:hypothetical protein
LKIYSFNYNFYLDGTNFWQCDKNGENEKSIKKSTYLWMLREEKHRVSCDRLYRFKRGKKEIVVDRVISDEHFYKDSALIYGDYAIFKIAATSDLCVLGQVVNFEKNGKSKKERKFSFTYCILEINQNVTVRLSPCYKISVKGKISLYEKPFFTVPEYVASTKIEYFDLNSSNVHRNILIELQGKLKYRPRR